MAAIPLQSTIRPLDCWPIDVRIAETHNITLWAQIARLIIPCSLRLMVEISSFRNTCQMDPLAIKICTPLGNIRKFSLRLYGLMSRIAGSFAPLCLPPRPPLPCGSAAGPLLELLVRALLFYPLSFDGTFCRTSPSSQCGCAHLELARQ